MKTFSELQAMVHQTAIEKGWHTTDELGPDGLPTARQMLAWLSLVTDECDEAAQETELQYEADGKPEGILVEYADAIIRIMDWAGACKWDVCWSPIDCDYEDNVSGARNNLVNKIRTGDPGTALVLGELCSAIFCEFAAKCPADINHSDDDCYEDHLEACVPKLFEIIERKDAYNRTRSWRHQGKLA